MEARPPGILHFPIPIPLHRLCRLPHYHQGNHRSPPLTLQEYHLIPTMSEDELGLTHYPALRSPTSSTTSSPSRARSLSSPSSDTESNSNSNEISHPPMRSDHEHDNPSVWWCSFKMRTPQAKRPAIIPN